MTEHIQTGSASFHCCQSTQSLQVGQFAGSPEASRRAAQLTAVHRRTVLRSSTSRSHLFHKPNRYTFFRRARGAGSPGVQVTMLGLAPHVHLKLCACPGRVNFGAMSCNLEDVRFSKAVRWHLSPRVVPMQVHLLSGEVQKASSCGARESC